MRQRSPSVVPSHMEPQPGARRRLVVIYGATLLALAATCVLGPVLLDVVRTPPPCVHWQWGRALAIVFAILFVVAGAFVVRRGRRVLQAGRVPLAEDPVWVRMRIRTGLAVTLEAWVCLATGASLLLTPCLVAILWWDGWSRLFQGFPGSPACGG